MTRWWGGWMLSCASFVGLSTAAGAVEIVGSTQATLGWAAAPGAVAGYYVIVTRDSSEPQVEGVTLMTQETVDGAYGQTILVQVAAFGADGAAGPLSNPSDPITFVQSASSGGGDPAPADGGGTGGDPSLPGGGGTNPGLRAVARDFTGDGYSDLLVRSGAELRVWPMQGGHAGSEILLPNAPAGADLVGTGDYDGNGSADLLWEDPQSGKLTLWRVDAGVVVATDVASPDLPSADEWHVGGSADFDGDGTDDVLRFSRVLGSAEIWSFDGTALVSRSQVDGHLGAWSVAAAEDTNGDGLAEIVWLDEQRRVLERQDPATAASQELGALTAGWMGRGGADVDGDGRGELVMLHPQTGAVQAWHVADSGALAAVDLPNAQGLGENVGTGDFDGDGRVDLAWADPATGAVTLWLDAATVPTAVDRALPAGVAVLDGASGSDDSAFYDRFCSGDLDGNGKVDGADFASFRQCYSGKVTAGCDGADMDSDGIMSPADFEIFKLRYRGEECAPM